MKKDNIWNRLYSEYIKNEFNSWEDYFAVKMKLKKPFYDLIVKYSIDKKPILECGAGTGKFSAYLSSCGFNTVSMDLETAMVEQGKELSKKITPNNPVKVLQGDISAIPFDDKYFSVAHSSGVLEHFEDKKIVQLINEQLRVSDTVVFSVPTTYFEKKMLGDERFMQRKEWRKIVSKSNSIIVEESGYHYKTFKKRFFDILLKPKTILKPIALFIFVLKDNKK